MGYTYEDIAGMIDHALLQPNTTEEQLEIGIQLALTYQVASVCILPYYLKRCADLLVGSSVVPSTVIGFPHGGHTTAIKQSEAVQAISDGGQELDMVVNISRVLSGDWDYVRKDIAAVIDVAHDANRKVKVIFENCYLQDEQKIRLCQLCGELGADWVKTSTGYGTGGATMDDLRLMRANTPDHVQVKAAGGIRDFDTLLKARDLGVTRCGASATKSILDECRLQLNLAPIEIENGSSTDGY